MTILILILLFAVGAIFVPRLIPETRTTRGGTVSLSWLRTGVRLTLSLAAVFMVLATSFVIIDQDKVGHLKLIYGTSTLPPGHIIAMNGEAGPQAEILGPGFNFKPLLNILYDVEQLPVTEVPEGHYGYLVARDGLPLREYDAGNGLEKFNPLAGWTEKEVWTYIRQNVVPYNALHDKFYPSIGCAPCTRALSPGEDIRAGRWWWESPESKECGLHVKG